MRTVTSFTFSNYEVDDKRSVVSFCYKVEFAYGLTKTFTDRLYLPDVPPTAWATVPKSVLEPTLQALLLMLGINYWSVFRTKNIKIEGFNLTKEQADFWNELYLHGLSEFFYYMKIDFHDLINFPYSDTAQTRAATSFPRPPRSLLLNGAGKDSILSAELLKAAGTRFDFFVFAPSPAHTKITSLVGSKSINVTRRRNLGSIS